MMLGWHPFTPWRFFWSKRGLLLEHWRVPQPDINGSTNIICAYGYDTIDV
jgi:hypothetical protein